MTIWRQLIALLLPGAVVLVIPAVILSLTDSVQIGWGVAFPWNLLPVIAGIGLIGCGLLLMIRTVTLFMAVGRGTLAPWNPPRKLVVRGIYRHVRNPMITGVCCILLGESVLLGVTALFDWFGLVVIVNLIYIPLVEEPDLAARFGEDYHRYKRHVPRWIPRRRAWMGLAD